MTDCNFCHAQTDDTTSWSEIVSGVWACEDCKAELDGAVWRLDNDQAIKDYWEMAAKRRGLWTA